MIHKKNSLSIQAATKKLPKMKKIIATKKDYLSSPKSLTQFCWASECWANWKHYLTPSVSVMCSIGYEPLQNCRSSLSDDCTPWNLLENFLQIEIFQEVENYIKKQLDARGSYCEALCIYIYIYIYICVCVCLYMCIYMYIYILCCPPPWREEGGGDNMLFPQLRFLNIYVLYTCIYTIYSYKTHRLETKGSQRNGFRVFVKSSRISLLRVSEVNVFSISNHVCVAYTTFKQLHNR